MGEWKRTQEKHEIPKQTEPQESAGKRDYPGERLEKRRRRQAQVRRRAAVLLLLLLAGAAGLGAALFLPSRRHMEPAAYFAWKVAEAVLAEGGESEADAEGASLEERISEVEQQLAGNARAVVLQDQVDGRLAWMEDGALYLEYSLVQEQLNERFFWQEETAQMLFTTPLQLYVLPAGSSTYTVEGREPGQEANQDQSLYGAWEDTWPHPVVWEREGTQYLAADFVQQFTNLEILEGLEGCHVKLNCRWGTVTAAAVKRKEALRLEAGIKSDIVRDLAEGEEVTILREEGKWVLALSGDGFIGYVRSRALETPSAKELQRAFEEPDYTTVRLDQKVRLVWHAVDNADVNRYLEQDTKQMSGINVISPTWFAMSDNEGHFISYASKSYVKKAHRMGLQVWGLLSNFSSEVSTFQVTAHRASRKTLEKELIQAALEAGLDGINVDLEAITSDSAPGYVQFVRELSILCRINGLVLSVDVPVPMPFNTYYNRKELGTVADYIIMMGYDEHYYGSEAGSVASLPFEENGIIESLEQIPKEKLVSGIPFYTRIWYSWEEADGTQGLSSDVISMYRVLDYLAENGVEVTWDEQTGQNYAEWTDEGGTLCRIWVEDEASIKEKAELVNTYDLGGFGAWVLGDEKDVIWSVLEETVKG